MFGQSTFGQSTAVNFALVAKVEAMVELALVSMIALNTSNMGNPNAMGTDTVAAPVRPALRAQRPTVLNKRIKPPAINSATRNTFTMDFDSVKKHPVGQNRVMEWMAQHLDQHEPCRR